MSCEIYKGVRREGDRFFMLARFIASFPRVKSILARWMDRAAGLESPLRELALDSLETKAFHCLGAAVYSLYPGVQVASYLEAAIALQTISDYLDNLCDRAGMRDEAAFRRLHLSFMQALKPGSGMSDYYAYYPYRERTYLPVLVATCQRHLSKQPHYQSMYRYVAQLARFYCKLQVLKHLEDGAEDRLQRWAEPFAIRSGLRWYEWAAAAGSTLGIFMFMSLGWGVPSPGELERVYRVYFPWLQALHILLDYCIDQKEDREHGDLNFTAYYADRQATASRLKLIYEESRTRVESLPVPLFHEFVIRGLVAMYGSDPKVRDQSMGVMMVPMLADPRTRWLYRIARGLRAVGYVS